MLLFDIQIIKLNHVSALCGTQSTTPASSFTCHNATFLLSIWGNSLVHCPNSFMLQRQRWRSSNDLMVVQQRQWSGGSSGGLMAVTTVAAVIQLW